MNALRFGGRTYLVRRPLVAFLSGAAVAVLGGLIGLGGAEFRLPILIMAFAIYAHRAVRINLLISLATLATAACVRLRYLETTDVLAFMPEMAAVATGGVASAWVGAGALSRIPREKFLVVIALMLAVMSLVLIADSVLGTSAAAAIQGGALVRVPVALVAGLAVGAVSSVLGVAGGEFIIPSLIFLFGADIKTAGTASVIIGIPIVIAGIVRHIKAGRFRSQSMLVHLVLPMSLGSVAGALLGGYLTVGVPVAELRIALAAILLWSAIKLWRHPNTAKPKSAL